MDINIKKMTVKYNQMIVGYLMELEQDQIAFQYDAQWILNGFSISPFSLPLTSDIYMSASKHFDGLYGVFNDSLPDGWGELLVRRMLAKKAINFDKLSALTRLTLISNNGLGGLSYEPTQKLVKDIKNVELDRLATEIKKVLYDHDDEPDLDQLLMFGGSSGGARPKAHVKLNDEHWIIKFPARMDPLNSGELEYTSNQLAQSSGINVNAFKLFETKQQNYYFGAQRFDRQQGKRVHMISLSGCLETTHQIPNLDYMHLFQVIQKICIDQEDLYEAFRRMCFNALYKNKDDHGKNFAFIYDEALKGYKLSKAYDITQTSQKFEHEMTVLGQGNPKEEDLIDIAKEMKLSLHKCLTILNHVKKILNIEC